MSDLSRPRPSRGAGHHHSQAHHYQGAATSGHVIPPAAPSAAAPSRARAVAAAAAVGHVMTGGAGAVRRNLFQSQLTRRPTAASSASLSSVSCSSSAANSAETLRLDGCVDVLSDSDDIVVRDRHGEIELGDEPTHGLDDGEEEALDERQENQRERERLANAARERIMISQEERKRLGDAVTPTMKHRLEHGEHEDDHLDAVKASLRAKVAALDEDNWMFEPEPQKHR